jgi:hypothetical protein
VFEVHGEPGAVYSILSAHDVQVNGKFVFQPNGRPSLRARNLQGSELAITSSRFEPVSATVQKKTIKIDTKRWTHPGNYIGNLGIKLYAGMHEQGGCLKLGAEQKQLADDACELRIRIESGAYERGFHAVMVNDALLQVADHVALLSQPAGNEHDPSCAYGVHRSSTHSVTILSPHFRLTIVNSDHFLNIDAAHYTPNACGVSLPHFSEPKKMRHSARKNMHGFSANLPVHGLLGHTATMALVSKRNPLAEHHHDHDEQAEIGAGTLTGFAGDGSHSVSALNAAHNHDYRGTWRVPGCVDDYKVTNGNTLSDHFIYNRYRAHSAVRRDDEHESNASDAYAHHDSDAASTTAGDADDTDVLYDEANDP